MSNLFIRPGENRQLKTTHFLLLFRDHRVLFLADKGRVHKNSVDLGSTKSCLNRPGPGPPEWAESRGSRTSKTSVQEEYRFCLSVSPFVLTYRYTGVGDFKVSGLVLHQSRFQFPAPLCGICVTPVSCNVSVHFSFYRPCTV